MSTGNFDWTNSGDIDLSAYSGTAVYVAFLFTSTDAASATWEVDDITITGEEEAIIEPEPTNYPTNFTAGAITTNIGLSWTDAIGDQLPSAYIIFAGTDASLPVPADGIPVNDDTDLSDGSGAINVDYGMQQTAFTNLDPATTYYFSIYSYTNTGVNTDYKNDGTSPTAEATTGYSPVIEFEDFDEDWGGWIRISVIGDEEWTRDNNFGINNTPCAKMSGYANSQNNENEDWLISPQLNLGGYESVEFSFYNATQHDGPAMEAKISTDYDGTSNPNTATWTNLDYTQSTGNYEWTFSEVIDLTSYAMNNVYVAFLYTSTNSASAIWEVDDVLIESDVVNPEPSNYPTNFSADEMGSSILLSWTDAFGPQLPEAYIVFASTNSTLPIPEDGVAIANDPDLSNGSGTMNVDYGVGEFTFEGFAPSTTYYFSIYSYTNSGSDIDYKNDGTAPTANATTSNTVAVTIEEENFDDSWGDWTRVSVTGVNQWERDNTWGIGDTPCASATGYMGGSPPTYEENDDWLISPAMNFNNYENEQIVFYNAMNYSGPDMEFKVSTDYDGGGDPYSATWTDLSYSMSTGDFDWTNSGEIDLSSFDGNAVYVAFRFSCTNSESATWEVDDIEITGEEEYVIEPEPTNYPENFTALSLGLNIKTTWTEAAGDQLPDGYIVFAGLTSTLPVPTDGITVQIDSDLSDGEAAVDVAYGEEMYLFEQELDPFTEYFFSIYPYTNAGTDINYKNDGTAPTSSASTSNVVQITHEEETFNDGWGLWTRVSVLGSNEWDRDNTYGPDYTPCATMTGYMGGSPPTYDQNEDWLISPELDFENYINNKLEFMNAKNYSGPDMEVMVSTDYDGGGDPNSANWTSVPFTPSSGDFAWISSGSVNLADFTGSSAYVAFLFTCTSSGSATWEVDNILITGEEVLGIGNSIAIDHQVSVSPNPTNGMLHISQEKMNFDEYSVLSLTGYTVKRAELNNLQEEINLTGVEEGIYFIRFINTENGASTTQKVIVR